MEKGLIIYQSKYGAAKKYAQWLAETTHFDIIQKSKKSIDTSPYHTIILCGGIYASGIAGISYFKKNVHTLTGKKTAIFCVGASPYDANALSQIKAHNLKGELQHIPLFYGRGAWDEKSMTSTDRLLCKLLQKSIEKKDPSTYEPWMKALMSASGQKCDWTDREYLKPLLEYINS